MLRYSKYGSVRARAYARGWVVCARYRYTSQSLVGIWRRKLILPSAVALACISVRKTRVCVLPKRRREPRGGKKKDEAENFPLVVLPNELLARAESDAARRHGSHLGPAPAVNISTQREKAGPAVRSLCSSPLSEPQQAFQKVCRSPGTPSSRCLRDHLGLILD